MLDHENNDLHPQVLPIYRVLADSDPERVLKWLSVSHARDILADLAKSDRPITHEMVDQYLPNKAAQHLRAILVAGNVLPWRDERLAALERWTGSAISAIADPQEQRVVRAFATWHHLRRVRRMHPPPPGITPAQAAHVRGEVRAAITLLNWLHANDLTLTTCGQRDLDRWLVTGSRQRYRARSFVRWCARHGYARHISIPLRGFAATIASTDLDERWPLIRRLLHDDTIPTQDRVAGLLLLLYAQPLIRITRLTRSHLIDGPDGLRLRLGKRPVQLPPPLDDLVRNLPGTPGHAVIGQPADHPWLLPGGTPGQPIGPEQLARRLHQNLGIHPRAHRRAALIDHASQMPAVVLSGLLGMPIASACRWATRANAAHAMYAGITRRRVERPSENQPAHGPKDHLGRLT